MEYLSKDFIFHITHIKVYEYRSISVIAFKYIMITIVYPILTIFI
jgi:hypothetical protein